MYDWPTVDWTELQRARTERTGALMDSLGLDHLLVTSFDNIRYVTGYRTLIIAEAFDWFAAIASRDGDFEMFVPWIDEVDKEPDPDLPGLRVSHPVPSWTPAIPHASYWTEALRGVLNERRARRVGYEMLYAELLGPLMEALPEVEFLPVTTALHDLRARKGPAGAHAARSGQQGQLDSRERCDEFSGGRHDGPRCAGGGHGEPAGRRRGAI